jgi:hypothetical protein
MPFLKISHLFELLAWDSLQGASVAGLKRVDHDSSCKKKKPKTRDLFPAQKGGGTIAESPPIPLIYPFSEINMNPRLKKEGY